MLEKDTDLVVIGAGPAGLAAALAAAEAGVGEVILIDRLEEPGGILQQCIHNGFGLRYFGEELTGPEYAWRFIEPLAQYPQIQLKTGTMVIELTADRRVVAINPRDGLVVYRAKAVILAMGCRERPRGAINIPGSRPAGIFTAGTVQRLMNIEGLLPGKTAVILGSGDIGLIMARRLTLEGVKVRAVLELLPYSSGLQRNIVQCLDDYQIPLYLSHTVTRIRGEQRVSAVEVAPVDDRLQPLSDQRFAIDCDTLVLSVGLVPENELSVNAGVQLDPATGGPLVDSNYQTNLPGIFACGNVVHVHDLVDDVTEESRMAGGAAALYIRGQLAKVTMIRVSGGRNVRSVVPQQIAPDRPTTLYVRARFPERNRILRVADNDRTKLPVVAPGETIRYTLTPKELQEYREDLSISIEGGASHA
ncbi:thioredoxin reductase [Hydrogenispora ethanolica]|uniref:Thioredoxin reductase n=1 Tax=Hydrogenispora ethanolica TaxID=1082276 RepID=A0A4R1S1Z9_HYDET|nr:FAD-dependent oxidoreductase [Hydrogenispora ethanolica]TCL72332.1 thioredoxin reductase [Hydrogenispora ethanolica]